MVKKKYVEKGNEMCLRVREKNKEGKVVAKTVPASNFVFSPITQVSQVNNVFLTSISCEITYNKIDSPAYRLEVKGMDTLCGFILSQLDMKAAHCKYLFYADQ